MPHRLVVPIPNQGAGLGGRDANPLLPSEKTEVAFVFHQLTGLWGAWPGSQTRERHPEHDVVPRGPQPALRETRLTSAVLKEAEGQGGDETPWRATRRDLEMTRQLPCDGHARHETGDVAEDWFSGRGRRATSGREVVGFPPVGFGPSKALPSVSSAPTPPLCFPFHERTRLGQGLLRGLCVLITLR